MADGIFTNAYFLLYCKNINKCRGWIWYKKENKNVWSVFYISLLKVKENQDNDSINGGRLILITKICAIEDFPDADTVTWKTKKTELSFQGFRVYYRFRYTSALIISQPTDRQTDGWTQIKLFFHSLLFPVWPTSSLWWWTLAKPLMMRFSVNNIISRSSWPENLIPENTNFWTHLNVVMGQTELTSGSWKLNILPLQCTWVV